MDEDTRAFLKTVDVRPAPRVHVARYKDRDVRFEERFIGPRLMLMVECPVCKDLAMVDSTMHQIAIDRSTGALSLSPSLVCPADCGFHVMVTAGVATDC